MMRGVMVHVEWSYEEPFQPVAHIRNEAMSIRFRI
jgi:hypothetical protein